MTLIHSTLHYELVVWVLIVLTSLQLYNGDLYTILKTYKFHGTHREVFVGNSLDSLIPHLLYGCVYSVRHRYNSSFPLQLVPEIGNQGDAFDLPITPPLIHAFTQLSLFLYLTNMY
jgi:hypothetical protein